VIGQGAIGGKYRVFRMTRHGRPVLATPCEPLELRLAGLMRFHAYTGRRLMYRRVMRALMRLGLDHWFAEDAESPLNPALGFDFNGWLEEVRREMAAPGLTASVFWPTEAYRKRIYVHLFDARARPVGFVKVSLNDDNDERLGREAVMLHELEGLSLTRSRVPRVLADKRWRGRRYLILEPVPERAVPRHDPSFPAGLVDEFAGPARTVAGEEIDSLSWWARYQRRLTAEDAPFDAELRRWIAGGVRVRRQHGDFGRHNVVMVDGHPWVFDWEEASDDAPAITDEVSIWTTAQIRDVTTRPGYFARRFAERFLRGATPERRCDIMTAVAFRYSRGMFTAAAIIRNWSSMATDTSTDTYRKVFAPRDKAEEYEKSMCESRGYAEVLWRVEQQQLAGVVGSLRRTHPRIESLDFAAGTGRITRFVEGLVDQSTAIEISPAMIEVARQKVTRTTFHCKDVTAPDDRIEGSYDLITAFRFVVNAEPALRLAGLRALAARLRDDSSVLVFNNHGNLLSHKMFFWPFHRASRMGKAWTPDGNYMTDGAVRELADRAGLVIDRVMGCGLLSGRGASMVGFERAVRWERALAGTWLANLGGNQMYIARRKPRGDIPPAGKGGSV